MDTKTQPELTIVDLQNIRAIIDMAAKRGAFSASELSAVGATYDRLESFLDAVSPNQTPENSTQERE